MNGWKDWMERMDDGVCMVQKRHKKMGGGSGECGFGKDVHGNARNVS